MEVPAFEQGGSRYQQPWLLLGQMN